MKQIIAVIRIDKINETKKVLSDIDVPSFTAINRAYGRGKGKYDAKVIEGVRENQPEAISLLGPEPPLRPQRVIMIVVQDKKVKEVVNALIQVNQTPKPGDGKIFVLPMNEAIRVRTTESGDIALD